MSLPELYFRTRDAGALVFRLDSENRNRRMEMEQIAVVNLGKDDIRPHGDGPTEAETKAIRDWMEERRAILAMREIDGHHLLVDQLNLTAQWAQSRASDAQLDELTDPLLLAMHDLRTVLVRKLAERMEG